MREYVEPYQETEEEFESIQMQKWLAESHYWVQKDQTFYCKWCGKPTTTILKNDAYLCKENPIIKSL